MPDNIKGYLIPYYIFEIKFKQECKYVTAKSYLWGNCGRCWYVCKCIGNAAQNLYHIVSAPSQPLNYVTLYARQLLPQISPN